MKRILILGTSTVQKEAVQVCQLLGLETHVCSNSGLGPAASAAERVARIDITDMPGVMEYARQQHIDFIYSVGSDLAMPTACRVSEELGLPAFVSAETAIQCNSKPRLRTALGTDFPGNLPFQTLTEPDPALIHLPYPLMLKPADSQGGRGVARVDSAAGLGAAFENAICFSREKRIILEEYTPGPEYSINLYLVDGEIVFSAISDRLVWPQFEVGLVRKHRLPAGGLGPAEIQQVIHTASQACTRLGIANGPAYFQIKLQEGRLSLIEITPRLDGCHLWRLIRYAEGVDLLRITFEHLLGQPPQTGQFTLHPGGAFELEFTCQPPGQPAVNPPPPPQSLYAEDYYTPGEPVRRINGLLEKTGYFITRLPEPGAA